jgi:hypothetical protein
MTSKKKEKKLTFLNQFSEARDHILISNILFFNKLRQIIPEVRSEMRDLHISIFILKTTGTFTPITCSLWTTFLAQNPKNKK